LLKKLELKFLPNSKSAEQLEVLPAVCRFKQLCNKSKSECQQPYVLQYLLSPDCIIPFAD